MTKHNVGFSLSIDYLDMEAWINVHDNWRYLEELMEVFPWKQGCQLDAITTHKNYPRWTFQGHSSLYMSIGNKWKSIITTESH